MVNIKYGSSSNYCSLALDEKQKRRDNQKINCILYYKRVNILYKPDKCSIILLLLSGGVSVLKLITLHC